MRSKDYLMDLLERERLEIEQSRTKMNGKKHFGTDENLVNDCRTERLSFIDASVEGLMYNLEAEESKDVLTQTLIGLMKIRTMRRELEP